MDRARTEWWLWPGLLSLEAPLVAVSWLYMFAYAWQVNYLPWPAYAALGISVWLVYVVDRLMESRLREPGDPSLGPRHGFHRRNRRFFLSVAAMAAVWLVVLQLWFLPMELLTSYSIPALLFVVGFFILAYLSAQSREVPFMRNLVAGLAFGYGTAAMAHIFVWTEGVFSLLGSREMLGFAVLCAVNITAIHIWERERTAASEEERASMEMGLTLPLVIVAVSALAFAYMDNPHLFAEHEGDLPARPFFLAILISAGLILLLHRNRQRFGMEALRSLADLAMIVPLPLFLVISKH